MLNLYYDYGYFDPYYILALFGIFLIVLELFVPGGIVGTAGTIVLIFSVMVITETIQGFVFVLGAFLLLAWICIYLILKIVPKSRLRNSLFLFSSLTKKEGYNSVKDMSEYMGCVGKTLSIMRPVGKVQFGNKIIDAMASNNFIEEGKFVEVIEVQVNKIIVKERQV